MARTNTLTNYLTDVASAIKTKKGDSTPILASNFDTEIANLPSGGGDPYTDSVVGYTGYTNAPYTTTTYKRILSIWLLKEIPDKAITIDNATGISLAYGFYLCKNLEKANLSSWINLSNITNFKGLFYGCTSLLEANIKGSNLTNPSNFNLVFKECSNLKKVDISGVSGSMDIGELFNGCISLEFMDIRGLDLPNCSNVMSSNVCFLGSNQLGYVPTTCKIIVADQTQKDYMATNFASYTNVKTVAEYEAE